MSAVVVVEKLER